MPLSSKKKIVELCRELRRNSTEAEDRLWQSLRNRKLNKLKFNRQYPISYAIDNGLHHFFIADFYCHEQNLVVEVDGKVHEHQKDYDEGRSHIINQMGIRVIRFTNEEVMGDMNEVLRRILKVIKM